MNRLSFVLRCIIAVAVVSFALTLFANPVQTDEGVNSMRLGSYVPITGPAYLDQFGFRESHTWIPNQFKPGSGTHVNSVAAGFIPSTSYQAWRSWANSQTTLSASQIVSGTSGASGDPHPTDLANSFYQSGTGWEAAWRRQTKDVNYVAVSVVVEWEPNHNNPTVEISGWDIAADRPIDTIEGFGQRFVRGVRGGSYVPITRYVDLNGGGSSPRRADVESTLNKPFSNVGAAGKTNTIGVGIVRAEDYSSLLVALQPNAEDPLLDERSAVSILARFDAKAEDVYAHFSEKTVYDWSRTDLGNYKYKAILLVVEYTYDPLSQKPTRFTNIGSYDFVGYGFPSTNVGPIEH